MKKAAVPTILVAVVLLALGVIAEAQQPKKVPRIGYLSPLDPATESARSEGIRLALRSRLPNNMELTSLPMYRRDASENVVNQLIQILDENCVNGETDVKTQTHPRLLGL
jgi:hypothetical protein